MVRARQSKFCSRGVVRKLAAEFSKRSAAPGGFIARSAQSRREQLGLTSAKPLRNFFSAKEAALDVAQLSQDGGGNLAAREFGTFHILKSLLIHYSNTYF